MIENPDILTMERHIEGEQKADADAFGASVDLLTNVVRLHVELDRSKRLVDELLVKLDQALRLKSDSDERVEKMTEALNSVLGWSRWSDNECVSCREIECECDAEDMREECRRALRIEASDDET